MQRGYRSRVKQKPAGLVRKLTVAGASLVGVAGIALSMPAHLRPRLIDHTKLLLRNAFEPALHEPARLLPAPTPAPNAAGYPSPFPRWPNALALTTPIDAAKAAGHIKAYDAGAVAFYSGWRPEWSDVSHGELAWGSQSNYVVTSGPGSGFYAATNADPTYNLRCTTPGYCGYSHDIVNVHVPPDARTQNSGAHNCDCHLYLLEPVGWTPKSSDGFKWPILDASRGLQYEIDIENASTSDGCEPEASAQCTTFRGPGTMFGFGIAAFSTGSTGWYGGQTPSNDGFSPANAPPGKWGGSADHSNTPYTALVVTPHDILQGVIKHETGLALVCSEEPQPDVWPAVIVGTDYSCHDAGADRRHENLHATGWSYGDHIWLQRSAAEIRADVASRRLTPVQGVLAANLATFGAVVFDNAGTYGPTYQISTLSGDAEWLRVAAKYNLPNIRQKLGGVDTSGVLLNLSLPVSYMQAYAHAIDSCVIRATCR